MATAATTTTSVNIVLSGSDGRLRFLWLRRRFAGGPARNGEPARGGDPGVPDRRRRRRAIASDLPRTCTRTYDCRNGAHRRGGGSHGYLAPIRHALPPPRRHRILARARAARGCCTTRGDLARGRIARAGHV